MTKITLADLAGTASGLGFALVAEWGVHLFRPIPLQSEAAWMLFALGGAAFLAGNYAARGLIDLRRVETADNRSQAKNGDEQR